MVYANGVVEIDANLAQMKIEPKIEITEDGSHTLLHHIFGDFYHSIHGARTESNHVFIENGFNHLKKQQIRILEVGFGTGLNALLTMQEAERKRISVEYTAVELYPISMELAHKLSFASEDRFIELHKAPPSKTVQLSTYFNLKKLHSDLIKVHFDSIFDLVYFDAFAPDTQPELWRESVFERIYNAMELGGVLVTYTAKGDVKRALRTVGFTIERLKGAPGKRHMIRATKVAR